jgi:hypothetical protein
MELINTLAALACRPHGERPKEERQLSRQLGQEPIIKA